MSQEKYVTADASLNLPSGGSWAIWKILENVYDPEIPVLSIVDLGIVRNISVPDNAIPPLGGGRAGFYVISITPTYSGCPAMDVISMSIRFALLQNGYKNIKIVTVLSPAWTTEWMTEAGKQKLKAYGIAPPGSQQNESDPTPFQAEKNVQCPRCNSFNTQLISRFGSTACKAFYSCYDCKEPFDYFKCH